MSRRHCDGWNTPATLLATAITSFITLSSAHQSISFPTPISFDLACRVGLGRNCPGPCPTQLLRKDQTPNSPSVTVRRGGVLPVHILKNNHVGGFSRWSLVKVSDMYSKKKHAEGSFLFTCADNLVTFCTRENQDRDCKVDRMNQYYRHFLRIPRIYPDGFYVLGWSWYGGAVSTGTHGAFGDYYDCVYVRIKGGPNEDSYQPIFKPGPTMTGRDGMCRATTNRVGHCYREPCPFGNRRTTLMKPAEFHKKRPTRILRKSFMTRTHKGAASNVLQKGNLSSSDYKPKKASNKAASRPSSKPTPKPTSRPSEPSKPVRPTANPTPTPKKKKKVTKKSVSTKAATGTSSKPSSTPTSNATSKQTSKPTSKPAKPTSKPMHSTNNKNSSSGSAYTGNADKGKNTKHLNEQQQPEGRVPEPRGTPNPTNTPKPNRKDAKKIAKQQRQREKRLRQKAKMRERREKKLRKAEEKKEKLEAKRLRRKKVKEERAIKKEKRRQEKQRKKEEKKARKLAKKEAKRKAKRRSKRSFARPQQEDDGREYDDCFEEGIFPRDDGHIDYGDPTTASSRN